MQPGTSWSTYDQSSAPITGFGISTAARSPSSSAGGVEGEAGGVDVVDGDRVAGRELDLGLGAVGAGDAVGDPARPRRAPRRGSSPTRCGSCR